LREQLRIQKRQYETELAARNAEIKQLNSDRPLPTARFTDSAAQAPTVDLRDLHNQRSDRSDPI